MRYIDVFRGVRPGATMSLAVAAIVLFSCQTTNEVTMKISSAPFGDLPNGGAVTLYTLTNGSTTVKISTYGAAVTELWVPDRNGVAGDVVLGFESLKGYLGPNPYFGCIAGRYANRIAKGHFAIDGTTYQLTINDGLNHLHGGLVGFDKVLWKGEPSQGKDSVSLKLRYDSKHLEEGYPGNLAAAVTYTLTADGRLKISYEATTDTPTIVNLTHHSYFNLAGAGTGDILEHRLRLFAPTYTPVDATLIPTGKIDSVAGGPMDFLAPVSIGARISQVAGGYDHNWILERKTLGLSLAATVEEPTSGRSMEVWTTEPAIQFYSGNFLDGTITGKNGKVYQKHFGFCLETQHYPDSPNNSSFPTTVLRPGEKYTQYTEYRFSTLK